MDIFNRKLRATTERYARAHSRAPWRFSPKKKKYPFNILLNKRLKPLNPDFLFLSSQRHRKARQAPGSLGSGLLSGRGQCVASASGSGKAARGGQDGDCLSRWQQSLILFPAVFMEAINREITNNRAGPPQQFQPPAARTVGRTWLWEDAPAGQPTWPPPHGRESPAPGHKAPNGGAGRRTRDEAAPEHKTSAIPLATAGGRDPADCRAGQRSAGRCHVTAQGSRSLKPSALFLPRPTRKGTTALWTHISTDPLHKSARNG